MGDVYLVQDTKLERKVALKVLPPEFAADPERRARFVREAQALATLDHPNIVTVHSVEEANGVHFITMELVRGKSLDEVLPKGGWPLGKFFDIAIPLADAVAAAHEQKITHRDLKPANVMVTDDGRVKVLDFGIAIAQRNLTAVTDPELQTRTGTQEGSVVGTPAYMSPEQAEGSAVDARSDIFSLGIVFYEMLTGERPFGGSSAAATLFSISRDTPRSVIELQPALPRQLERVVHRCLVKDPIRRYQSAIDLRNDLDEVKQQLDSGEVAHGSVAPDAGRLWTKRLIWLSVAVAAAGGGYWIANPPDSVERAVRLQNARQLTFDVGVENHATWAPDGARLAYESLEGYVTGSSSSHIWVAQVGSGEPVNLTKDYGGNNRMPSWSPDGREIAFFSDRGGGWGLYVVPAIGGTARNLLPLPDISLNSWSAPRWSADGAQLFVSVRKSDENVVFILPLKSLEATHVLLPKHEGNFVWDLSVRPDGRRFAYVEAGGGAPEVSQLWTIPAAGGERVPLTDGRTQVWSPTWSSDGRKIFYVSNRAGSMDLWQQAISDDGRPLAEPIALTQGIGTRAAVFSPDGTKLAYTRGRRSGNVWQAPILADRPITWTDAAQLTSEHAYIEFLDLSPDGRRLAISSDRRGNQDLWLLPANGGEMTPLTTDPAPDWNPRWSPDAREIAFYSYRSGNRDVWVMPSAGGPARQLTTHPAQDWFPEWSPDGREIAFHSRRDGDAIWILPAKGGEPRRLSAGAPQFAWAPDGQSLVFRRDGSLYRIPKQGGEPLLVGPGYTPRFSPDGQTIHYSVVTGPQESHGHWSWSLASRMVRRLTRLEGRRGRIGDQFVVDSDHLYFTWCEDDGDVWVMDVMKAQ